MIDLANIWADILRDFGNIGSPAVLAAFGQVLLIDIMLAGDNAIVVGALAAGLPADQRRRVIMVGIAAALVLRIVFALVVSWLMGIVGLVLAGGLLLLWVAFRMWRDLRHDADPHADAHQGLRPARTFAAAAWSVAVADVSMSLDNVLGVAGAARAHPGVLVIGLLMSVALMGVAANYIARIIERYQWVAWLGLAAIVIVAMRMIYDGLVHPKLGVLQFMGAM